MDIKLLPTNYDDRSLFNDPIAAPLLAIGGRLTGDRDITIDPGTYDVSLLKTSFGGPKETTSERFKMAIKGGFAYQRASGNGFDI